MFTRVASAFLSVLILGNSQAFAEGGKQTASTAPPEAEKQEAAAPAPLVVFFAAGSSEVHGESKSILDRASRAFNEGKPIVMVVSASTDSTGSPQANLLLSQQRAIAVLRALLNRGIPADRFQILAKGETELPVPTPHGVSERDNRRVVITWR